jgi:hypothetical protein
VRFPLINCRARALFFSVGTIATKMMASYKEALGQKNIEKLVQIMQI